MLFFYINNQRVDATTALESFYLRAHNRRTYTKEEVRRIFDLACAELGCTPFRKILAEHQVEILEVVGPSKLGL